LSAAFGGSKPVISVAEFRNVSSATWGSSDVSADLAGMLSIELSSSGLCRLVGWKKLGAVLDEQDLAASARVSKSTGAQLGKLTGAQYVIVATVSAFDSKTRETGGGLSFRGISVGGKSEDAYIAVDLRVVDTTTGEIAYRR